MGSWFDQLVRVAGGLLTLALLGLIIGISVALIRLRRAIRNAVDILDSLHANLTPLLRDAATIATNLGEASALIREGVEDLNDTVTSTTARVRQAVDATERQVREFGAVLDLVQRETEQVVVSSSAVLQGLRAGAAALAQVRRRDTPPDHETSDDAGPPERRSGLDGRNGAEDFPAASGATDGAAAPRIRHPRSRRHR
ncbi:MAG TPA: hypothetical protein VMH39_01420 [Gemmatimonadaceae bacterium]|nr:hypothetical protein [Gemmatimonadaceae bacterium]